MQTGFWLARLVPLIAGALVCAASPLRAQDDKPVTPPDSYRVVMENERMRMIEIHIKPHSKVNVDSPANRERFLYMLSDGALILAPPGKTPYEFALHAGETAVFPAVSPTVENDTDAAVRALMVEVKGEPARSASAAAAPGNTRVKASRSVNGRSHTKVAGSKAKPKSKHAEAPRKSKSAKSTSSKGTRSSKSTASSKGTASSRKASAEGGGNAPLNLSKANARPGKKVTGKKARGNDS